MSDIPNYATTSAAVGFEPCPFCGVPPLKIEWKQESSVYCGNHLCFARPTVTQMTLGKAISAWNRRLPTDGAEPATPKVRHSNPPKQERAV